VLGGLKEQGKQGTQKYRKKRVFMREQKGPDEAKREVCREITGGGARKEARQKKKRNSVGEETKKRKGGAVPKWSVAVSLPPEKGNAVGTGKEGGARKKGGKIRKVGRRQL